MTAHAPPKDEYSTTTPIPIITDGTTGTSKVALTTVPIANACATENACAQDDRKYSGDQACGLAVVGFHDVAEGVGADVVLEFRCTEVADQYGLNAEGTEGELVDVPVRA